MVTFKEEFLDAQKQGTDNFKILSENPTTIGGNEAVEVYSTGSWVINQNPMELKAWLVLTMKNGYGYAFSYANEAADFDALVSDAQKIYQSLFLQDVPPTQ